MKEGNHVPTVFGSNDRKVRKSFIRNQAFKRNQLLIILVPVFVLLAGFVTYQTFASGTTVRFAALEDTYVAKESPNSNYSKRTKLLVRGAEPAHATSYLKFNLQGISGKTIQSAKLRIKTDSEPSLNVGSIYVLPSSPKPYSSLTWYSRPSLSGAVKIGNLQSVQRYTWYEIPLTYTSWRDGIIHLAFDGGTVYDAANFLSANTNDKPQLVLTYGALAISTPKPTVNITADPPSVISGGYTKVSWSSTSASSCTASGSWAGTKPISGSATLGPITANATYTITCNGEGGSTSASTSVAIFTEPTIPTTNPIPQPESPTQPAISFRSPFIPFGIWNVNDQNLKNGSWIFGMRFVLKNDTSMYRFISGFNMEGIDFDGSGSAYTIGSRSGYGNGNGGTILARLTEVKADGTPDFNRVLAQESFNPVDRYKQSKLAYGAPGLTQLIYINVNNVRLTAGKTYVMTYQNIHTNPSSNFVSVNSPTVREAFAGPNGRNNLDPSAKGAIAGLDPREVAMWSTTGGSSWVFGRLVGSGYYSGSVSSDDGTRLPWYGWQSSATAKPVSNQPYYAYTARGNYVLRAKNAKQKTTITYAGGYAPVGSQVGVVTVKNISTGVTTRTTNSLGEGIVYGTLEQPLIVDIGQELEIRHSGAVAKIEGDTFIVSTFGAGAGDWSFTTDGHGADVAQLFVLPWPYYR